ncbi:DUF4442 domain-containing protein [Archangium sp. Cb G35]|uniref:PaaI family thioesterase n=1 Tax=Archangium sp. Cb G35 TaxID=1920190 RepID=UPI0009380496|nr:PaaI family thioesterase [Archangium sp. Cb G35]OJT16219.1 DUF4442 domain-containing protein [Archangium sp. Cb G35]
MNGRVAAPKTTRHLQDLERIMRGEAPPPPIAKLLGLMLTSAETGRVVVELDASARHANPMGTLHGGVICDLADLAMGAAMATTLEDEESFTTLDLTTKFLKPIWNARLRATGRVVKRTRALGLIECDVEDEKNSLVAKVFSSCMVLRGDEARGR